MSLKGTVDYGFGGRASHRLPEAQQSSAAPRRSYRVWVWEASEREWSVHVGERWARCHIAVKLP